MFAKLESKQDLEALKQRFKRLSEAKDVINDGRVSLGIDSKSGEPAEVVAQKKLQETVVNPLAQKLDAVNETLKAIKPTGFPGPDSLAPKPVKEEALTERAIKEEQQQLTRELDSEHLRLVGELESLVSMADQMSYESLNEAGGRLMTDLNLLHEAASMQELDLNDGILEKENHYRQVIISMIVDRGKADAAAAAPVERARSEESPASAHEPDEPFETPQDFETPPRRIRIERNPVPPGGAEKPLRAVKKGEGARKNHVFRLGGNGAFGSVQVSLPDLAAMKLKATKGGKLVMNKRVDPDFVDLVTKRFNPKRHYSPASVEMFRQLVRHSDLPMDREQTGKMKLLYPGARGKGVQPPMSVPEAVARLTVLTGELDSGNNSTALKNELGGVIDYLVRQRQLSKRDAMTLYQDYVA